MTAIIYSCFELKGCSSSAPIPAGQSFESEVAEVGNWPAIVVAVKTDKDGILYVHFSTNGVDFDSVISYNVAANTNEVHKLSVTRKYFKVSFTNTSATAQTFFRLQAIAGTHASITSPLNSLIQVDADTLVVRPLDFNLMVAQGLYQNHQNTIKDGINLDVDAGTNLTADITNESVAGSPYAGFPLGAPEEGQIVVAGADTGTVYYSYLESSSSTDYIMASKAVSGAGNYNLGHNIWRCNFAYFVSSNPTSLNVSNITIRHRVTTANIFCVIQAGNSQSFCSAYTVPAGSTIFIDRATGNLRGSTSGSIDGAFWYRPLGQSPRYRFPFELQYGTLYFDDTDYLISIPAGVDIVPRCLTSSTNNLVAKFSYRFIKVKT